MEPFETVTVDTPVVACDGGEEGHPRVFLHLTAAGSVECPYCSRLFVRRGAGDAAHPPAPKP
jgi:uncharacterized Zn-finger protein